MQAQLHAPVGKADVVVLLKGMTLRSLLAAADTLLGVRTALPLGWAHPAVVVQLVQLPSPIRTRSLLPALVLVLVMVYLRTGLQMERELHTANKLLLSHLPQESPRPQAASIRSNA
jgi:hypothetical protein